jgi:hypothetical protein
VSPLRNVTQHPEHPYRTRNSRLEHRDELSGSGKAEVLRGKAPRLTANLLLSQSRGLLPAMEHANHAMACNDISDQASMGPHPAKSPKCSSIMRIEPGPDPCGSLPVRLIMALERAAHAGWPETARLAFLFLAAARRSSRRSRRSALSLRPSHMPLTCAYALRGAIPGRRRPLYVRARRVLGRRAARTGTDGEGGSGYADRLPGFLSLMR